MALDKGIEVQQPTVDRYIARKQRNPTANPSEVITSLERVNKVLGPRFITKYGTKQEVLVLGRDLPLGIDAAIGAGGDAALGRMAIGGARRAFGPVPEDWPSTRA